MATKYEYSGKSGIYCILNKINNHRYIGSASDFRVRFQGHLHALRKRKHHSIYLQRAWDKYGENNFDFQILEYLPKDNSILVEKERYYFHLYKPEYNIYKDPVRITPNKDFLTKRANELAKHYIVTNPEGVEIEVFNLKKFCRENDLDSSCMNFVVVGRQSQHRGWKARLKDNPYPPHVPKVRKSHKVIRYDKDVYEFDNVTQFAKEHGVHPTNLFQLISGKIDYIKGFKRYG